MKECIIRAAKPEDSEKIGFVHYHAWIETYTGMIPQSFLATRSVEKSASIFCESKCKNIVVAEIDEKIVGFCGFGEFRDSEKYTTVGEIYSIYLLDEFKRKHLGQKMIEYALEQLKKSGYNEARLWVLAENRNAIIFYEKQGFVYSSISKEATLGKPMTEQLYTIKL